MRRSYFRLLEGVLFSLPLLFASCGNGDNALEEIINGGGSGGGTPVTPEEIIYAFSLRNMADDADITAGLFKLTDQNGTDIAYATSDGKYTIKADDLSSVTTLWLEVTSNEDKKYIAKATVEELPAIAEAGKLKMATLGDVILSDGKFAVAGTAGQLAKIAYLGNDAETNTKYNHGLALALADVSEIKKWCNQTGATCLVTQYDPSTQFNDLAGIDNTDYLINHAPTGHTHAAASAARNYGTYPTGTSAWFLPSAGQWDKMIGTGGYGLANLKNTANGYTGLSANANYWSSTQRNDNSAWGFSTGSGSWGKEDKNNYYRVRACLAF